MSREIRKTVKGFKKKEGPLIIPKPIMPIFSLSMVSVSIVLSVMSCLFLNGCRPSDTQYAQTIPVPVAGTVSHHLLAHRYIDDFFKELASRRDVSTFIILSPQHYLQQTDKQISLVDKTFEVGEYRVPVNEAIYRDLIKTLDIEPDPWAFLGEHGIEALIPYIARYFPEADIVPILQREEILRPDNLIPLSDKLSSILKENPDVFMLLSVDFSHHQNLEITESRDKNSRIFLENITTAPITIVGCDNIGGMFILQNILKKNNPSVVTEILDHTNSLEIGGGDPDDITSYFFTFFTPYTPFTPSLSPLLARKAVWEELKNPTWTGEKFYSAGSSSEGVAVRFHTGPSGMTERGCMVFLSGVDDWEEAVKMAAIDAALFDPRYLPVSEEELPTLDIDVLFLSDPTVLDNPLDFNPKKHSIAIRLGEKHAFIQSTVSVERGWNKKEFLGAVCKKAGLEEEAWIDSEAKITRYSGKTYFLKGESEARQNDE